MLLLRRLLHGRRVPRGCVCLLAVWESAGSVPSSAAVFCSTGAYPRSSSPRVRTLTLSLRRVRCYRGTSPIRNRAPPRTPLGP